MWNRELIREGVVLVERALTMPPIGPYTLQAAISAVHADAARAADTNWTEIIGLYDVLLRASPSPIVNLNRAVAVAMRDGPEVGLALVDALVAGGELNEYYLLHAARADMCRRLGRRADAINAYHQALARSQLAPERRYFEQRLAALQK